MYPADLIYLPGWRASHSVCFRYRSAKIEQWMASMVLASKASGCFFGHQTLEKNPSGQNFLWNL